MPSKLRDQTLVQSPLTEDKEEHQETKTQATEGASEASAKLCANNETGSWPAYACAWSMEQQTLVLLVIVTALLFISGPSFYCWLSQGRAELADTYRHSAHASLQCYKCQTEEASQSHHYSSALQINRPFVDAVISNGIRGLLMMVATVLGGIGADIPAHGIFAVGMANLAAYGLTMGFGDFIVESAKDEFSRSQLAMEYDEVHTKPDEELSEMVCHYRKRGLSETDAKTVAEVLSKYKDFWVQHMMAEELGVAMPRGKAAPAVAGLASTVSFIAFGMLPLLGVSLSLFLKRLKGPRWYRPQFSTLVALLCSSVALMLLGTLLSLAAGSRGTFSNSLLLLTDGCAAAALACALGQACMHVARREITEAPAQEDLTKQLSGRVIEHEGVMADLDSSNQQRNAAWPFFRKRFLLGILALLVGISVFVVSMQFVERAEYDSFRVFGYGWLTCITTGLGAVPFMFVGAHSVGDVSLAAANAAAGGMMLAASGGMLLEAHEHCGSFDWQLLAGLLVGALFIRGSEQLHSEGEAVVEALHACVMERHHLRKAMLIFTVMFCHSAAEGVAVGVAFSKQLKEQFGLYISLLLAVHNVPEGLAVALVLVPRGVKASSAVVIATLTSVPQPLLALAAFLFVDAFKFLLPLGLAFAAGAMVYVCFSELLKEAAEQLGWRCATLVLLASFTIMTGIQYALQAITEL